MKSPWSDLILHRTELRRLAWGSHPDLSEDSGQLELQATEVANLHVINTRRGLQSMLGDRA